MYPQLQHLAALATAQQAAPGGCAGGPDQLLLPITLFAILYFVWLRPASNDRKKHAEMLKNLKRGDKVITTSGIIGTIADKAEKTVTVTIDKNTRVEMLTSAIARRFSESEVAAAGNGKPAAGKDGKAAGKDGKDGKAPAPSAKKKS